MTGKRRVKRGPVSAADLLARLRSQPEWLADRAKAERALQEAEAKLREAEAPIIEELNSVGCEVGTVWDLVNSRAPYRSAIPVLLKHLTGPYPDRVREGLARALATPLANQGWTALAHAFEEEQETRPNGVKWALALALGASATSKEVDEVIRWSRDASLGEVRAPLLDALSRCGEQRCLDALTELVDDPVIGKDAEAALRRARRHR